MKSQVLIQLFTIPLMLLLFSLALTISAAATYNLGNPSFPNQFLQIIGSDPNTANSVGNAGDTNNDGMSDIFIGAPNADVQGRSRAGIIYIVFSRKNGPSSINLDIFDSNQGFRIFGAKSDDNIGEIVVNAGDVNNDGVDDLLVGAQKVDGLDRSGSGIIYVIFGRKHGFSDIDLANLDSTQGYKIIGAKPQNSLGDFISSAGDVNGDHVDDIIIRAYTSLGPGPNSPNSQDGPDGPDSRDDSDGPGGPKGPKDLKNVRIAYVIYGRKIGSDDIDLNNFSNTLGFRIIGTELGKNIDLSVSNAGDINDDGIDDIVVGAYNADFKDRISTGIVYAIYGRKFGNNDINLAAFTNYYGFKIIGTNSQDTLGSSLSDVGDVNGDGIDDIVIGAPGAIVTGRDKSGMAYVIYGRKTNTDIDLANLNRAQGYGIMGAGLGGKLGKLVGSAGDVNKDGIKDIIIGTDNLYEIDGGNPLIAYIVLGRKSSISGIDLLNEVNPQVIKVLGMNPQTKIGRSIGSVGDVNGDDIDDIIFGTNQNTAVVISGSLCPDNRQCLSSTTPICYASRGCACIDAGYIYQNSVCEAVASNQSDERDSEKNTPDRDEIKIEDDSANGLKTGILAGVIIGVALVIAVSVIAFLCIRRRKQHAKKGKQNAAEAYQVPIDENNIPSTVPGSNNNIISIDDGLDYAPKLEEVIEYAPKLAPEALIAEEAAKLSYEAADEEIARHNNEMKRFKAMLALRNPSAKSE